MRAVLIDEEEGGAYRKQAKGGANDETDVMECKSIVP